MTPLELGLAVVGFVLIAAWFLIPWVWLWRVAR